MVHQMLGPGMTPLVAFKELNRPQGTVAFANRKLQFGYKSCQERKSMVFGQVSGWFPASAN
jgi:hypothetical protein